VQAIAHTHLADFARMHPDLIDASYWTALHTDIIAMCAKFVRDRGMFNYLDCLTAAVDSKILSIAKVPVTLPLSPSQYHVSNLERQGTIVAIIDDPDATPGDGDLIVLKSPLYIATYFGNLAYLQRKISQQPQVRRDANACMLFLHCLRLAFFDCYRTC
jgi:hypothetical protein